MKPKEMPVLVGVGQLTNRSKDPEQAGDPIDYLAECAKKAADDAHISDILPQIDSLSLTRVMSRDYTYDPTRLAQTLGANPKDFIYTTDGATIPQVLTARLCERIAKGQSDIGLICGAEAFHSSGKPDWKKLATPNYEKFAMPLFGDRRDHASSIERKYGLHTPSIVYPLFANAVRKSQNLSLEEYIRELGLLCEKFSKVAQDNEYAWFRDGKDASEISTITDDNRMINYPFTKYMNAIMNVDQAAALLIMSEHKANAIGVPQDKRVYLTGSSEVYDKWYISDRDNYYSAPGLELAFSEAFRQAKTTKDDIEFWDLYSCFPVAVQIAINTLELPETVTPTVTGGLPYFGGPGNHYSLHAICEMMRLLRKSPEKQGVVQCLSWHMHKFAVGIYSGMRPEEFHFRSPEEYKHNIENTFPNRRILEKAEGTFRLETYVVSYDKEGNPALAIVIANNERGERLFAVNDEDVSLILALTTEEPIGKKVRVRHDPPTGLNRFSQMF
jgi:acetyl-CoA C-acetyltransferase